MPCVKIMRLVAILVLGITLMGHAAVPVKAKLHGHVPPVVAQLVSQGRFASTNHISLAIGLPLRDPAGLDKFLAQVYDPGSPLYHQFLTPEELTARFGPTEADYETVKNFARTNGLVIIATHGNRLLLDVRGPATAVERAFHVTLSNYRHPTEPRVFFAPEAEPRVDGSLPIADVSGLENYTRPYTKWHHSPTPVAPRFGSAPNGFSYLGSDFRTAYVPGTSLDGSGQMVGLVQFEGYFTNDIVAYATLAGGGRTNIIVQPVLINGFSGTPDTTNDLNGIGEVSLDIEMAMAMAPGLSKIVVFEGGQANFSPNDVLNTMAASNTIKNLSSSWGWNGGPNTTTDNIFKVMAAQGQSYFNASGDSDAFLPGTVDLASRITVPSSSPYITQVGGTTLSTAGAGGNYTSEITWNWGFVSQANAYIGSSGGVSTYYAIPDWQQGVNSFLNNGGSMTHRNIPDVALTADGVYVLYGNGLNGNFGGTSCAAPLWAGFMALINQQAALSGKPPIGFLNPAVYELANQSIYSSVFHDITTGNNSWSSSPKAFFAVPGYDLCTGVGTPTGTNLINALVNPDPLMVVSNGGFVAVASPAGDFSITSATFTLANGGLVPLDWSLINTSAWLNVSSSGGTIAAGDSNAVVVSLNNTASNLLSGTYPANVIFSNSTTGIGHVRFFALQVADTLAISTNYFSFSVLPGGLFNPPSADITLSNARAGTLNWSINNTSTWFNLSQTAGSLAVGTQTNVTFAPTSAVTNLAVGAYTVTFQVTNLTTLVVQTVTGTVFVEPSLVSNGGFETDDFTRWTLIGTAADANFVDDGTFVTAITSRSGTYFAALGEFGALATLAQTLPTVAGQKYLLSFWLNNPQAGSFSNPNQFRVSWNGSTLFSQVNFPLRAWTNMQFLVTATATNTVLQFGVRHDHYYFGLDDVTVTPGFAPAISAQPTNLVVLSDSNAVFSVTATGSTNLIYHWTKNGTNLVNGSGVTGATNNLLTLAAVTTNSTANYAVVITNRFGSITSSVVALTVVVPPAIASSSLTNRTTQCGSNNLTFSVNLVGTAPLSYQWSLDGTPVLNATNSSFSITNLYLPNHIVGIVVTNLYGSLSSNAMLTVQDIAGPAITLAGSNPIVLELGAAFADPGASATDTCAGVVGVIVSGSVNTNSASTNTLTYVAGDGNGNTNTATRTVIVADTTPPVILWSFTNLVLAAGSNCLAAMPDVTGTNFVLASDLSGALTVSQNPTNNAGLLLGTNLVVITVKDASGNTAISTNTIVVQDQTPPVILAQSQSQTNSPGATVTLSVAATACTPLTIQWFFNAAPLPAQTNLTLVLSNLNFSAAGNYASVIAAAGGSATSAVMALTVYVGPGVGGVTASPDGSFMLSLLGTPGYSYILESATNLSLPIDWLYLATNTLDTNGVWQFTDSHATNHPQQFYRLMLAP